MKLAIIIVNYRTPEMTIAATESVLTQIGESDRVYVVDGGSGDDSPARLSKAFADSRQVELILLEKNGGFAFANNAAIRMALQEPLPPNYVLLLNPDTVARPSAIEELVSFLENNPNVGLVGSRLEDPDGTTQLAARRFHGLLNELDDGLCFGPVSRLLRRWHVSQPESDRPHETDWVPGASLMIRRKVFDTIGFLDEGYFMYFEEVDFCRRARQAGFPCWYVPQSRVIHFVGQASGVTSARPGRRPRYWFESRARYWLKNHGVLTKLACDVTWTISRALFHLRAFVQHKPNEFPPHLWWDFVKFNFGSLQAWRLNTLSDT